MKVLSRKVFITIFSILSLFVCLNVVIYNIQTYKKEYDNIRRNLSLMDNRQNLQSNNRAQSSENDLDNMLIVDYEVYTIKLNNTNIEKVFYHNNSPVNFDIEKIVKIIVKNPPGIYIGNLYNNQYSYNYGFNTVFLINTQKTNEKLTFSLLISALVLVLFEIFIYIFSRSLTKRITKPAKDALEKQKAFVANASHELKTPLSVIMASADAIKPNKNNTKYLNIVKHESDRMNYLIKSLLDLSKMENDRSSQLYKKINISEFFQRICLYFDGIAFEKGLKIDVNIKDNIVFNCIPEEIERLISIVLDNAIKHSYPNSVIKFSSSINKGFLEINICNHGDPINEGDEEKIFERFYRGDESRNRKENRYGLGLAIAKQIVNNYHGVITAYSKNNLTTFIIRLKK